MMPWNDNAIVAALLKALKSTGMNAFLLCCLLATSKKKFGAILRDGEPKPSSTSLAPSSFFLFPLRGTGWLLNAETEVAAPSF